MQFATIFHLLQQGCSMLEYEAIKLLYEFLIMPTTSKKHWNDNSRWTIAKFMHQEVLQATRVVIGAIRYIALSVMNSPY